MVCELGAVARWIYARLASDADGEDAEGNAYQGLASLVGGRVYEFMVPENGDYPCVLFTHLTGRDVVGTGARRIFSRSAYHVKAICKGNSFGPCAPIAARIDALLQQAQDVTDPVVLGVHRVGAVQSAGQDDGVRYNNLGGEYTFFMAVYGDVPTSLPGTSLPFTPSPLQSQIDALSARFAAQDAQLAVQEQQIGDFIMAYSPVTNNIPSVPVTATTTLTQPQQDTRYPVNISANAVITLPPALGNGRKLYFDFDSLGSFACTFALNGSDAYVTTLPPAITGASFALVSNTAGKWSIE